MIVRVFPAHPRGRLYGLGLGLLAAACLLPVRLDAGDLRANFAYPPLRLRSRPLWFWNGEVTTSGIQEQVCQARASGDGGLAILPDPPLPRDYYLSPDYFDRYA